MLYDIFGMGIRESADVRHQCTLNSSNTSDMIFDSEMYVWKLLAVAIITSLMALSYVQEANGKLMKIIASCLRWYIHVT